MAMRAVLGLMKFDNLCRELQAPRCLALGVLEMIWHFTATNAPRGDIGRYSNQEIASWIGWIGDADKLIAALVKTGWLDTHPGARLSVHHWSEHADKAVRLKIRNKGWVFVEHEILTPIPKESSGLQKESNGDELVAQSNHIDRFPGAGAGPESGAGNTQTQFGELPEKLSTDGFKTAWTAWEQYRKQSEWGCVQPISRVQVWKKLEPLGANEAENRVRTAVAKGYRNIVDDAVLSIPNGKAKGPEPPKRTYKDSTALRIAAEKRCAELEQSGMEPEDMIESLAKEFGHDLPSTIRSKLTKQTRTHGKEKAEK